MFQISAVEVNEETISAVGRREQQPLEDLRGSQQGTFEELKIKEPKDYLQSGGQIVSQADPMSIDEETELALSPLEELENLNASNLVQMHSLSPSTNQVSFCVSPSFVHSVHSVHSFSCTAFHNFIAI